MFKRRYYIKSENNNQNI